MIESLETAAYSLNAFTTTLAASLEHSDEWPFAELCRRSAWARQCVLTGSQFGVLFAFRSGDATAVQMTVQPNASETVIFETLGRHPLGREATLALEPARRALADAGVHVQLAIGERIGKGPAELRVYLGSPDDQKHEAMEEQLFRTGTGFGWNKVDDASLSILSALKRVGLLIGAAKRFGPSPGQALYFAIAGDALLSSIEAMTPLVGEKGACCFRGFADELKERGTDAKWGWTAVCGADLRVRYMKLEASSQNRIAKIPSALEVTPFYRILRMFARNHELDLGLHTMSLGVGPVHQHRSCYLGLERAEPGSGEHPVEKHLRRQPRTSADVADALARAVAAVASAQASNGSWSDFCIGGVGASDAWVTAFIGAKLAELKTIHWADSAPALARAADFVGRSWKGGLAFNRVLPIDADSTAHALLFWISLRRHIGCDTVGALLQFQGTDGGFRTFVTASDSKSSWSTAHPEVTAVAIQALWPFRQNRRVASAVERAFSWAEAKVGLDKCLYSFWWELDWYARLQWTKTFRLAAKEVLPMLLPRSAGDRFEGTCCLDAAYLLELCLAARHFDDARIVANGLLEAQLDSGLWPTKPILRVVADANLEPWKRPTLAHRFADVGYYSSAAITSALDAFVASEIARSDR